MNRLFIKRASPNTGIVYSYGRFFEKTAVTAELSYVQCKDYISRNQEDLKIYKVARILNRKNARRTLYKRFLATNEDEAKTAFVDICKETEDDSILQLLTGDWKMIAEKRPQ